MHRPTTDSNVPQWEQQGVYSKQYNLVLTPSDMEGNQMVSVTYDNTAVPQDQWAYDTKTRRTRKLVYNPYVAPEGGVTSSRIGPAFRLHPSLHLAVHWGASGLDPARFGRRNPPGVGKGTAISSIPGAASGDRGRGQTKDYPSHV